MRGPPGRASRPQRVAAGPWGGGSHRAGRAPAARHTRRRPARRSWHGCPSQLPLGRAAPIAHPRCAPPPGPAARPALRRARPRPAPQRPRQLSSGTAVPRQGPAALPRHRVLKKYLNASGKRCVALRLSSEHVDRGKPRSLSTCVCALCGGGRMRHSRGVQSSIRLEICRQWASALWQARALGLNVADKRRPDPVTGNKLYSMVREGGLPAAGCLRRHGTGGGRAIAAPRQRAAPPHSVTA